MAVFLFVPWAAATALGAGTGQLVISVVDRETGKPLSCRMTLRTANGKPRKVEKVPYWIDHFVIPGSITLKLPVGNYTFEMERGPEYLTRDGRFTIEPFADDTKQVDIKRCSNMAEHGWWSGDLYVRRPVRDIELLMAAEDLHLAEVVTWWNDQSGWDAQKPPKQPIVRFGDNSAYSVMAGGYSRAGTEMLLFNLPQPLKLEKQATFPNWVQYGQNARKLGEPWIDLTAPFWWDLPMLVPNGLVDSIEVANSHMLRTGVIGNEAEGKPRDRQRYPDPSGNAEWSQFIYFQLLECGLRIPPTAGSGSGVTPNPVGYNRAYVHIDGEFSYEAWFENLRQGRVCVTNGPLLQPIVNGQFPGHVFQADKGSKIDFELGLTLTSRDPITYLEIIKDGNVVQSVRFQEYAASGKLPKLEFDNSGWFLIRAVNDVPRTYRFAMTGPYFVEMGYQRRVSKKAAQFFLDWVIERAKQIKIDDPEARRELLEYHRKARDFWQDLVTKANAE